MEQLDGTVTMPLITYQKMRNDVSQIFDSHGTAYRTNDEKSGIWLYLNQEKLFDLAWEEMIRRVLIYRSMTGRKQCMSMDLSSSDLKRVRSM